MDRSDKFRYLKDRIKNITYMNAIVELCKVNWLIIRFGSGTAIPKNEAGKEVHRLRTVLDFVEYKHGSLEPSKNDDYSVANLNAAINMVQMYLACLASHPNVYDIHRLEVLCARIRKFIPPFMKELGITEEDIKNSISEEDDDEPKDDNYD